jgi:hypothetical protein
VLILEGISNRSDNLTTNSQLVSDVNRASVAHQNSVFGKEGADGACIIIVASVSSCSIRLPQRPLWPFG